MSEEDKLKTNNEKVTIDDYYYYYLLKCEDIVKELEKWLEEERDYYLEEQERHIKEAELEIKRLNNIINKAVEYIEYMQNISKNKNVYVSVYDLVKLLKGEDIE